jgi:hypothetical protein
MADTFGDLFIAILSSAESIPLEGSNSVFSVIDTLKKPSELFINNQWDYWNWLLNLEEMGFLDIDIDKKKVHIEPQLLCRSITSKDEFYVNGARTPEFINKLEELSYELELSFYVDAGEIIYPSRISIKGDENKIKLLADELNFKFSLIPPAYTFCLRELTLSELIDSMRLEERNIEDDILSCIDSFYDLSPSLFTTTDIDIVQEGNEINYFNPYSLRYDGKKPSPECLLSLGRRSFYGISNNLYYYSKDEEFKVCTRVSKKLAKYICMSRAGIRLGCNKHKHTVLVPKFCRLPRRFAQALTHCQNIPPREIELDNGKIELLGLSVSVNPFLEYQGVPDVIQNLIGTRLNIEIQKIDY